MNLKNLKVAILGAGRSGKAAARLAMKYGAQVRVFDSATAVSNWPEDIPLTTSATTDDGKEYAADLVVISPGIETNCEFVTSFASEGVEIIGEMELAARFFTGKIIAITGTNGKTTTTALLEKILIHAGKTTVACGNYGLPIAEVLLFDEIPEILALEVSSFQLETIRDFHPDIAIWLNFAPDHMDRYTKIEDYYNAKLRIFENMGSQDLAIIRAGEAIPPLHAAIQTFSSESDDATLSYRDGKIYEQEAPILDLSETVLYQRHNAENVMAVTLAVRHLGISTESIQEVLNEFSPPGHRCEIVCKHDDILWLNDSKATNLHALEAALKSQDAPVILIAGGKDKGLDYHPLQPMLEKKVRACVVFGQITDQLYDTFSPIVPTVKASDLKDCVVKARELAEKGDTVLFSPGTSSFDMFTGYVQRGQAFRNAVNELNSN